MATFTAIHGVAGTWELVSRGSVVSTCRSTRGVEVTVPTASLRPLSVPAVVAVTVPVTITVQAPPAAGACSHCGQPRGAHNAYGTCRLSRTYGRHTAWKDGM